MTMGYGWAWFSGTIDCSNLHEYADERLKDNIVPLTCEYCQELMYTMEAKLYNNKYPVTKQEVGFVAQDLKTNYQVIIRFKHS